jgi:hypothetical protein
MNLNSKKISAIIKITDFPSRNEIISFFKSFIPQKTPPLDYSIINKSNQILFIVKDHNFAYNFTETFNKKIIDNPLYSNTECSLSFKKMQRSSSTINNIRTKKNYSNVKSKIFQRNRSNDKLNNYEKSYKNISYISDYEKAHWANIKDKAGIIENDSPYMDSLSKEYIEKKKNEKKWVDKKNFNIFVGKASSVNNHNNNEIKNYVGRTPSLPPVLYQFRRPQKTKWVGNGDFHLY